MTESVPTSAVTDACHGRKPSRRRVKIHVPAAAAWIKSDVGGAVLVLGLGMVGGITTALVGGAPIGVALLLDAVKVSLGSAGGFVVVKKLFGFSQDKVAEAGAKAADANPPGGVAAVVGETKPLGS